MIESEKARKVLNRKKSELIRKIQHSGKNVIVRGIRYREILNVMFSIPPITPNPEAIIHMQVLTEKVIPKVERIERKILLDLTTRQAFLYFPGLEKGELPCTLTYLFLVRRNKKGLDELMMTVYMRSFDVFKKFMSDVNMALICQEHLAVRLGIRRGKIFFLISSCHFSLDETLMNQGLHF